MRSGFTLVELVIVLVVLAVMSAIAIPALIGMRDRVTVRIAAIETTQALADARSMALSAARRTAVRLDATRNTVTVFVGADTLRTLRLDEYGVSLSTTRDSIAFGPTGIGWGAATATITLRRGNAAAALAVSRLGRVRRT